MSEATATAAAILFKFTAITLDLNRQLYTHTMYVVSLSKWALLKIPSLI